MNNGEFQELMLQQLKTLTEGQHALVEGQDRLEAKVAGLEEGQDRLEAKMAGLEEGQDRLEAKMAGLEEGQKTLEQGQKVLEQGQQSLQQDVKAMQQDVNTLQQGQRSLEQGQLRIETRIENEVIEKIRALFDDRSVNQDYFSSIKDSLARIEENTEVLVYRAIDHSRRLDEHDRELRLLRAEKK